MQKSFQEIPISASSNILSGCIENEKILFESVLSELQIKFSDDSSSIFKELENFTKLLQKCANKINPFIFEIKNKEVSEYIDFKLESAKKLNSYFQKRLNSLKISQNSKDPNLEYPQNIFPQVWSILEEEIKTLITNFLENFSFDQKLLAIGKLKQLIQKLKDCFYSGNFLLHTYTSIISTDHKNFETIYDKAQEILNFLQNKKSKNLNGNFPVIISKFIQTISNKEFELKNEIMEDKLTNWRILAINSTNPKINDLSIFTEFLFKNFSKEEKISLSISLTYVYIYVEFVRENNFFFGNNLNSNFDLENNILFFVLFDFSNKLINIYSNYTIKFPLNFKLINTITDKNIFQSHLRNYEEYIFQENYENLDFKIFINFFKLFKDLKNELKNLKFFEAYMVNIYSVDLVRNVIQTLEDNKEKVIMTNSNKMINLILNRNGIMNTFVVLEHKINKNSEEDRITNSKSQIAIEDIHELATSLIESKKDL